MDRVKQWKHICRVHGNLPPLQCKHEFVYRLHYLPLHTLITEPGISGTHISPSSQVPLTVPPHWLPADRVLALTKCKLTIPSRSMQWTAMDEWWRTIVFSFSDARVASEEYLKVLVVFAVNSLLLYCMLTRRLPYTSSRDTVTYYLLARWNIRLAHRPKMDKYSSFLHVHSLECSMIMFGYYITHLAPFNCTLGHSSLGLKHCYVIIHFGLGTWQESSILVYICWQHKLAVYLAGNDLNALKYV